MSALARTLRFAIAALLLPVCAIMAAQTQSRATTPSPGVSDEPAKQQIEGGYSFLNISSAQASSLPIGYLLDSNYFFNRRIGIQVESAGHWGSGLSIGSVEAGPVMRWQDRRMTPFVHGNVGLARVSPNGAYMFGWGATAGAGLDVRLGHSWEMRLLSVDYIYNGIHTSAPTPPVNQNGVRVSAGVIWDIGHVSPKMGPLAFQCSPSEEEVYPGEPLHVTGYPVHFNPKRKMSYTWMAAGKDKTSVSAYLPIDTNGLKAGVYEVKGRASAGGNDSAYCSVRFKVKAVPPPSVHIVAAPDEVQSGGTVTITAQGYSSYNRPLKYAYMTSVGTIKSNTNSGNGTSAMLDTTGVAGPVNVTVTVTDDQGQSASSTLTVQVKAPENTHAALPTPTPVAPPAIALHSPMPTRMPSPESTKITELQFRRGSRPDSESRVDNVGKAILDDLALRLQSDPDSKAVIVGLIDPAETNAAHVAAQRAANVKYYLVHDQGISAQRVEVRTASGAERRVEIWFVPAGAGFDRSGTRLGDERNVQGRPRNAAR